MGWGIVSFSGKSLVLLGVLAIGAAAPVQAFAEEDASKELIRGITQKVLGIDIKTRSAIYAIAGAQMGIKAGGYITKVACDGCAGWIYKPLGAVLGATVGLSYLNGEALSAAERENRDLMAGPSPFRQAQLPNFGPVPVRYQGSPTVPYIPISIGGTGNATPVSPPVVPPVVPTVTPPAEPGTTVEAATGGGNNAAPEGPVEGTDNHATGTAVVAGGSPACKTLDELYITSKQIEADANLSQPDKASRTEAVMDEPSCEHRTLRQALNGTDENGQPMPPWRAPQLNITAAAAPAVAPEPPAQQWEAGTTEAAASGGFRPVAPPVSLVPATPLSGSQPSQPAAPVSNGVAPLNQFVK